MQWLPKCCLGTSRHAMLHSNETLLRTLLDRVLSRHPINLEGVGLWELGRTRDTGTNETIVLTKWRCYPQLQHYENFFLPEKDKLKCSFCDKNGHRESFCFHKKRMIKEHSLQHKEKTFIKKMCFL